MRSAQAKTVLLFANVGGRGQQFLDLLHLFNKFRLKGKQIFGCWFMQPEEKLIGMKLNWQPLTGGGWSLCQIQYLEERSDLPSILVLRNVAL